VGRIKGHYEWDNDDLAPGHKKEGGLHQNLFDSDGKLKGNARFIPDGGDPEPLVVTETVYVPVEERRLSREDEELQQAIAALVVQLIGLGIAKGKPLAEQWWRGTARPVIAMRSERPCISVARAARSGKGPLLFAGPLSSRRMRWMRHRSRTDRACRAQRRRRATWQRSLLGRTATNR